MENVNLCFNVHVKSMLKQATAWEEAVLITNTVQNQAPLLLG